MRLSDKEFLEVIERTPLVSIDLIIQNSRNQILMGLRTNQPAKGCWFVPGGRILKGESVADAFERITLKELNTKIEFAKAKLVNVYDHFYDTNFFDKRNVSTQYVVLAFKLQEKELKIDNIITAHDEQHQAFKWLSLEESKTLNVHENTIAYFKDVV